LGIDLSIIPVAGRYVLYRPLRRLAIAGNEALARVVAGQAQALSRGDTLPDLPPSIAEFLSGIGFLEPDPLPPPPPDETFQPAMAVLLLTSRCNLRCVYCYANGGEEAAEDLDPSVARAAIDHVHRNAVDLGRRRFELTFHGGGEPVTAWHSLQAAVAYARAKDLPCHISLVSNGVWTARQRDWLIRHVDSLTISLDGAPLTQDRQRPRPSGRGSSAAVMTTVRALDQAGASYGIRLTALPPWRDQLARDVEFVCRETGCRSMQVEPAFNTVRGEYRPPSPEEAEAFAAGFLAAWETARAAGRQLTFSGARPWVLTAVFCTAPHAALIVTPAGRLVTCYEIAGPRHPLAHACGIGRIEAGQVIVDEGNRAALLAGLAARRAACRDCFCYWHCAGDCHAKALSPASGAPGSGTRCQMNRAIVAQMLLSFISTADDGVWRGDQTMSVPSEGNGGGGNQARQGRTVP
jgi:uncharacterized protein